MAQQVTQLTKDILAAVKLGFSDVEVADLLGCKPKQVENARTRDRHRRQKQQVAINRKSYLNKKLREGKLAAGEFEELAELTKKIRSRSGHKAPMPVPPTVEVKPLLSEPEIEALQGINTDLAHKQELPISMESAGKYTFFERVKILFRGWA